MITNFHIYEILNYIRQFCVFNLHKFEIIICCLSIFTTLNTILIMDDLDIIGILKDFISSCKLEHEIVVLDKKIFYSFKGVYHELGVSNKVDPRISALYCQLCKIKETGDISTPNYNTHVPAEWLRNKLMLLKISRMENEYKKLQEEYKDLEDNYDALESEYDKYRFS